MHQIRTRIISRGTDMPQSASWKFQHSLVLFRMYEQAPGHTPYMAIAEDENGQVVGQLLAVTRWRKSLFPLYLYKQARVFGTGDYTDNANPQEIFGMLLGRLTRILKMKLCLYIEFSNIPYKMYGYQHLRACGYFPTGWMETHLDLKEANPTDRLSLKSSRYLKELSEMGLQTREATSDAEVKEFCKLLKKSYRYVLQSFLPNKELILEYHHNPQIKIYVTTNGNKVVAGCVCLFANGNAYGCYAVTNKKLVPKNHAFHISVWHAIEEAYCRDCGKFFIVDAGQPSMHNTLTKMMLNLGAVSTNKYRWYHLNIPLVNTIICKWIVG